MKKTANKTPKRHHVKRSTRKGITPDSVIKSACRLIFMRSRERAFVMKRDNYTCVECGAKQSKAKGKEVKCECHHLNEIDWALIIRIIRRHLLPDPKEMECLCKECHKIETDRQRSIK